MDSVVREVVADFLRYRTGGLQPLEALDLAMYGRNLCVDDFGRDAIPPASFAIMIALALDAPRWSEWEGMGRADKVAQAALLTVWSREVWPQFVARYKIGLR